MESRSELQAGIGTKGGSCPIQFLSAMHENAREHQLRKASGHVHVRTKSIVTP